jgi:mono/diheme cytochrome c family protein
MRTFSAVRGAAVLGSALLATPACKGSGPDDPRAEAKALFDSACGKCHGSDGRGGVPSAEGLAAPRNFADASFQASRTDAELREAIVRGKGQMPPFGKVFDEPQLAQLVIHIRSFNPRK